MNIHSDLELHRKSNNIETGICDMKTYGKEIPGGCHLGNEFGYTKNAYLKVNCTVRENGKIEHHVKCVPEKVSHDRVNYFYGCKAILKY